MISAKCSSPIYRAALLIVLLITAVMYANTTTLVRRQHRESAQETARAQQRLLDRVFLELIMIAQQVEGDAELSDYYVSSAGYGCISGHDLAAALSGNQRLPAGRGSAVFRRPSADRAGQLFAGRLCPIALTCRRSSRYTIPGFLSADKRAIACMPPRGPALIVAFTQPLIGNPKTRQIVFTLSEKQIDSLFAAAMRMRVPTWRCMTGRARCYIITATANRRWRIIPSLTVSTETSTVLSLRYAYWYDAQRINDSFSTLNRRFLALLTLAVLAAVALSVVMSVINFRPVRRLLSLVPGESLEQVARLDELQDYLQA